ncbi:YqgE/AlgH family protein [Saccharicrinis aurantiacus]|uniref:YqgE/AlgH family protein n=1 Tax=Saccharicrinis aurantiacus TaxID=1849719 RepID=UPI002492739E|nr:YqgE/AlgH family protein [Saccharicrinis aurantiacus]
MSKINFDIFKVERPKIKPDKGTILIADPFLKGPYFSRSIVLLTEYGAHGAVGFVLNKTSHIFPDEIIDDLLSFKGELYIGGPVSSDTLHFIHKLGDKIPGALKISDSLYWGGEFEVLKELINKGKADASNVKFFAGYSGWSSGQLEEEINENSWIVTEMNEEFVMERGVDSIWRDSLSQLGGKYETWSKFPEDPTSN